MAAVEIGLKAAHPAARMATGRGPEELTGSFVELLAGCLISAALGQSAAHHLYAGWWTTSPTFAPIRRGRTHIVRRWRSGGAGGQIRQACLAYALDNSFGIRGILEWQAINVIFQRVTRIDFFEFSPKPTSLLRSAQVAQSRCQEGARQICVGIDRYAILEHFRGGLILPCHEIRRPKEMQVLRRDGGVEAHGPFYVRNGLRRFPRIDVHDAPSHSRRRVIRVKR